VDEETIPTQRKISCHESDDEIAASPAVRSAYDKLNVAKNRNVDWFEGVAELEKQRAVSCLLPA